MVFIQKNISLAPFSTFFIGGSAKYYAKITSKEDLLGAIDFVKSQNISFFCLGGGSNLVFSDTGFDGMVLHFSNTRLRWNSFYYQKQKGEYLAPNGNTPQQELQPTNYFSAESGCRMNEIYTFSKKQNLDFSLFYTIPGTFGGAIAGNAGLPIGEIKDIVGKIEVFDLETQQFEWKDPDFFAFAYRSSKFHNPSFAHRYIIWEAELMLSSLSENLIDEKAQAYLKTRKEKQPWGRTAGSFFRNPPEGAAGMFLEKSGCKGMSIGGAFFSEKHANFMMSDGTATQADVKKLAEEAKKRVLEQFGVVLMNEVRLIDESGKIIQI